MTSSLSKEDLPMLHPIHSKQNPPPFPFSLFSLFSLSLSFFFPWPYPNCLLNLLLMGESMAKWQVSTLGLKHVSFWFCTLGSPNHGETCVIHMPSLPSPPPNLAKPNSNYWTGCRRRGYRGPEWWNQKASTGWGAIIHDMNFIPSKWEKLKLKKKSPPWQKIKNKKLW